MVERLSALDVSFLYLEGPTTPMHLGNLALFGPPAEPLTYERLVALVEGRIAAVPRYRQKVVWVPGHLANPVWVDDPDFDVAYHVRRSGLPKPGTDEQLREFCARIQSRPLDRRRPLWEMYLVEGLGGGRVAIVTKTHYAMVDGVTAIDLEQVILDPTSTRSDSPTPLWMPRPAPGNAELVLDAVSEIVRRPSAVLDVVGLGLRDLRSSAGRALHTASGLVSAVRAVTARPRPSPLRARAGERRRFATVRIPLEQLRTIHADRQVTVNDVVLAIVSGALRNWLLLRGEPVHQTTVLRAMVPVGVRNPDDPDSADSADPSTAPAGVSPMFVDLPVGEPNVLVRLTQIAFATRAHAQSGQAMRAQALVALGGFAPPTLHAMAARLAGGLSQRLFHLVVTNAPGPQYPLYAAGVAMAEIYPIVALAPGQTLAVGVTSYDGGVYFGLNADYEGISDVDVLAELIEAACAELIAANDQVRTGTKRRRLTPVATATRPTRARNSR